MCLCRKQSGCQVIPSEDNGRQWQFVFSHHAFQWKKRERLPACCLNLRQTVSVWVMGLPTAIVTAHLGGVMAWFSIFPVCLSSFFSPLCQATKSCWYSYQMPPTLPVAVYQQWRCFEFLCCYDACFELSLHNWWLKRFDYESRFKWILM